MKRKIALMTSLSLMTMGLAAAPALADDGEDGDRYEDRWDDDDRWDRDRDWDDDDDDDDDDDNDRWDRDRRDRWDRDDRWRDNRWDRGRHNGWRHNDRWGDNRYGRHGVTQRQAVAIAQYRGMRRIGDIDFDDNRWKIEGWGRRGEMEIEISARNARILDIDYD